jgi:AAA ATPase domain
VDAMKFGQWLAGRRHACGYSSQRAFVDAVRQHPQLSASGISEAFLARLEAGVLAHPFRGRVRARVLALSQLLCGSPRELRLFLRQAELTDLSANEREYVEQLYAQLGASSMRAQVVLPARPALLVGRTTELDTLLQTLKTVESGCCAITGMPGVGKTALATEGLHRLTADDYELTRLFPDGVVAVSGTGREGLAGLVAVLDDLCTYMSRQASGAASVPRKRGQEGAHLSDGHADTLGAMDVAASINRVRLLLADKSMLLLLDDVEADFPLRMALEAILTHIKADSGVQPAKPGVHGRRVVLVTSQYLPDASMLAAHLPLMPLEPEAALALFQMLTGATPSADERHYGERICASLGYLPIAIEIAAAAVTQEKIPLAVLETQAQTYPLDLSRDGTREFRAELARAIAHVDRSAYERLALIAALCVNTISLDQAAALLPDSDYNGTSEHGRAVGDTSSLLTRAVSAEQLARAAADLGQLVRHSLLSPVAPAADMHGEMRYAIHPLVRAYARTYLLPGLPKETRDRMLRDPQATAAQLSGAASSPGCQ